MFVGYGLSEEFLMRRNKKGQILIGELRARRYCAARVDIELFGSFRPPHLHRLECVLAMLRGASKSSDAKSSTRRGRFKAFDNVMSAW